ncbi:hypothetical protein SLA2020_272980 [Shorea laevis]
MAFKIESTVREVEDVDETDDGVGWGEYMRVRIILDLKKPLSRGQLLKLQGASVWVAFQYEKLPIFCFNCGIIRHGAAGCLSSGGRRTLGAGRADQFGKWLRVPSPTRRGFLGEAGMMVAGGENAAGAEVRDEARVGCGAEEAGCKSER